MKGLTKKVPGSEWSPVGCGALECAHVAQRERRARAKHLLHFGQDRERDCRGRVGAEVETGRGVKIFEPLIDELRRGNMLKQSRGLDEGFTGAALRAKNTDVSKRAAAVQQPREDAGVLFEAVGDEQGRVRGVKI